MIDDAPTLARGEQAEALRRVRHRAELLALFDAIENVRGNAYIFEHNEPDAGDVLRIWAAARSIEVRTGQSTDGTMEWIYVEPDTERGFCVTVYSNRKAPSNA